MRLLTHNLLICPVHKKPLAIRHVTSVDIIAVEYQPQFILRMIPRLDWSLLREAALAVESDCIDALPETPPRPQELEFLESTNDEVERPPVMAALQRLLLETHVVVGQLHCEHGEYYQIDEGIPNLLADAAVYPSEKVSAQASGAPVDEETAIPLDEQTGS
ncbi:hypothetical protein F1559_002188 [Cyanidiococcus yangmingshanensis]|uniref:Uncharacterized protein n=1 Tax=Cyanidiococcus yangmingshanensis TaxID=2690220 RepID=A0A7J7IMU9_9RHOD|nr:hypothetical protein F1559_002188 [Cyanidiococcus yangmingshanensis]